MEMPIKVKEIEPYSGLDEKGAENYYKAMHRRSFVKKEVIKPFEDELRAYTGLSDENIPNSENTVSCRLGDVEFSMVCTPTEKRPSYKDVFLNLRTYLDEIKTGYQDGIRRKGVITIKEEPYVSLLNVISRIAEKQEEVKRKGVKISIERTKIPELEKSSILAVPLGSMDLTEKGARLYLKADMLEKNYKSVIKGFENSLVELTGYSNKNVPEETEHMWESLGGHLFHVKSIPYSSTSYGKIMKNLVREGKTAKTTGDLVLIENRADDHRLEKYSVRVRDSVPFVSVNGMFDRMDEIMEKETKLKVRQKPIEHYPLI